ARRCGTQRCGGAAKATSSSDSRAKRPSRVCRSQRHARCVPLPCAARASRLLRPACPFLRARVCAWPECSSWVYPSLQLLTPAAQKAKGAASHRLTAADSDRMELVAPAVAAAEIASIAVTVAAAARCLRLGLADLERAAVEVRSVHGLGGLLRFGIGRHLDEAEALALARVAIRDQGDRVNGAACGKCLAQRALGGGVRQVADV